MSLLIAVVLLLLGAVLAWCSRRRTAIAVLLIALAWLQAVGTAPLPRMLLGHLQGRYVTAVSRPWAARNAIVLLGAGTMRVKGQGAEPPLFAYGRIARAAALYRQCKAAGATCQLLVSGGDPEHHLVTEAAVYGALERQLGVSAADLMLEQRSHNTWQNAQFSRPLLLAYDPGRVLLVTSGIHLTRSLQYFGHFGIHPEPVRGDLLRTTPTWWPLAWNMALFDAAVHEYIGIARYSVYNALGWNAPPVTAPTIPATSTAVPAPV